MRRHWPMPCTRTFVPARVSRQWSFVDLPTGHGLLPLCKATNFSIGQYLVRHRPCIDLESRPHSWIQMYLRVWMLTLWIRTQSPRFQGTNDGGYGRHPVQRPHSTYVHSLLY